MLVLGLSACFTVCRYNYLLPSTPIIKPASADQLGDGVYDQVDREGKTPERRFEQHKQKRRFELLYRERQIGQL